MDAIVSSEVKIRGMDSFFSFFSVFSSLVKEGVSFKKLIHRDLKKYFHSNPFDHAMIQFLKNHRQTRFTLLGYTFFDPHFYCKNQKFWYFYGYQDHSLGFGGSFWVIFSRFCWCYPKLGRFWVQFRKTKKSIFSKFGFGNGLNGLFWASK